MPIDHGSSIYQVEERDQHQEGGGEEENEEDIQEVEINEAAFDEFQQNIGAAAHHDSIVQQDSIVQTNGTGDQSSAVTKEKSVKNQIAMIQAKSLKEQARIKKLEKLEEKKRKDEQIRLRKIEREE